MIRYLLIIAMLMFKTLSQAQFTETIASGRPGQAIGARTLGKNVFQVQSGVNHNTI